MNAAALKQITVVRVKHRAENSLGGYWTEMADLLRGARGVSYTQNTVVSGGAEAGIDGYAALTASPDFFQSAQWREYADAARDIEAAHLEQASHHMVEPVTIVDRPSGDRSAKRWSIVTRRSGLDTAAFRKHWIEVHGGMSSELPHLSRYVQNHVRQSSAGEGGVDGFVEMYFPTESMAHQAFDTDVGRRMKQDSPNFSSDVRTFFVNPRTVLGTGE